MLMPHIRPLIRSAKLVYWDLRCRRKTGDADRIWERIDAIFGMADSLAVEPLMVSQLVRLVLVETGLTSLEEALGASVPPENWRKRLEQRLDPERLREGMRRSCVFELAMTHETITRFFDGRPTSTELDRDVTGFSKWLSKPETWRGAARCLDRLGRIHAALDPPAGRTIEETEAILQEFHADRMLFGFILAAYPRSWRKECSSAARMVLAREAMRLRTGIADLDSAPESVRILGKDPLFGRPLTYRRTEMGFALELTATEVELKSPWDIRKPMTWTCPKISE